MTTSIPRIAGALVSEGFYLRPRRPDDHRREFEELLPQMTPVFIYADAEGRDWIRWSMPYSVARSMGLQPKCACCGKGASTQGGHAFMVDTARDEVDWWFPAGTVLG